MKRIFLILGILAAGGAAFCALNSAARSNQQKLERAQAGWMEQTQQLAQAQSDVEALSARVRDLRAAIPPVSRDAALIDLLTTNDFNGLSLENQGRLLSRLGATARSADDFVVVPKQLLANSQVRAFGKATNAWQLTPAVRQILAINPDEQKGVESAFAEALQREGDWAKAHVQRSDGSNDMLVRYTIPVDTNFASELRNQLFTTVSNVLGAQRTAILGNYFDIERVYEDGAMAVNTNKLELWRVPGKTGLFQRGGWDMGKWQAMNTYPEPIHGDRFFPAAFSFIFPGGWQEVAQREGIEFVEPPEEQK
jgi:hypothetical protein